MPKRGTNSEIEWLQSIALNNPELDFDHIEEELAIGIEKIVEKLNEVYLKDLKYKAIHFFGQDNVHIQRNNSDISYDYEEGRYVILFVNKNDNINESLDIVNNV